RLLVVTLKPATKRVGQQLDRQALGECIAVGLQDRPQFIRTFEIASVGQQTGRIDRKLSILKPPDSNCIKVLEPEAQRIHSSMTTRARRVLTMSLELLTKRHRRSNLCFIEIRHVRRRRRRRRVQDLFENPFPAQNRRGPRSIRRDGQHACLRQKPAAMGFARKRNPAKLRTLHSTYPVKLSKPLVQKRVVSVDELKDASILA